MDQDRPGGETMKVSKVVGVLRQTSIFGNVHDDALNVLAFSGSQNQYARGDTIVERGKDKGLAFVILSGDVEIYTSSNADAIPAGASTMIGELSLLADKDSTVGVTAAADCEILRIDRELFGRVVKEFPEIAARLHQQLLERMRVMTNDLNGLEAHLRLEPVSANSRQIPQSPERGQKDAPNRVSRQ